MSERIIKKYPNRRLYDTQLNTYITLADVKELVVNRVDFQVIDARSKKDLTQQTLLQIIAEQENITTPLFSAEILQDFIRLYHQKSQSIFTQYLEQAMSLFIQQKKFFSASVTPLQNLFVNPLIMPNAPKNALSKTKESLPKRKTKKNN